MRLLGRRTAVEQVPVVREFQYRMEHPGGMQITDAYLRSMGFVPAGEPIPDDWAVTMDEPLTFNVLARLKVNT